MTVAELLTAFQTPLTKYRWGLVTQKRLLALGADSDPALAAKRCLEIMDRTELRSIFLLMYPNVRLTPSEIGDAASVKDIHDGLLPYHKINSRLFGELLKIIPKETVDVLKDYFQTESPVYYTSVITFAVLVMVLEEAGEISG